MQYEAEHREIPKEHVSVKPFGVLRKWYRGCNPAGEHRNNLQEWIRGNCGSWKKMSAIGRKMTRCAGVAWHKVHVVRTNQTRDEFARGTEKTQEYEKRLWKGQE
jgi:hypothetical protein